MSGPERITVVVQWTPPMRMSANRNPPKRSWDRWKNQGRDQAILDIRNTFPGKSWPELPGPYRMTYVVAWEKGRRGGWDSDNLKACMKGVRDAFEREGVIANDRDVIADDVRQERDPEGLGFVRVELEAA